MPLVYIAHYEMILLVNTTQCLLLFALTDVKNVYCYLH